VDATAKLLAIVALAAFATERILAAVSYVLNAVRMSRVRSGLTLHLRTRERRKLVLFMIAALIGFIVVDRTQIRLLHVLQIDQGVHPLIDLWLTWLVVVAGADRLRAMLGNPGKPSAAPSDRPETPVVRVQMDGGPVQRVS
jgi:hypothetical protein